MGKAGSQVCADDLPRAPCASQHVFASDLQDKQTKEQENKGDFLPRPFPQKLEKPLPVHRQPPASLVTQLQSTRALLRDRKATRPGLPDRGGWVRGRRVPSRVAAWPRDRQDPVPVGKQSQRTEATWEQYHRGLTMLSVTWAGGA